MLFMWIWIKNHTTKIATGFFWCLSFKQLRNTTLFNMVSENQTDWESIKSSLSLGCRKYKIRLEEKDFSILNKKMSTKNSGELPKVEVSATPKNVLLVSAGRSAYLLNQRFCIYWYSLILLISRSISQFHKWSPWQEPLYRVFETD